MTEPPKVSLCLLQFVDDDTHKRDHYLERLRPRQHDAPNLRQQWTQQTTKLKRYVKPTDQLLHLSSLLFKSKLSYQTHSQANHDKSLYFYRPIVELPRTEYGKPYIPTNTTTTTTTECSISHQYPYAGLAALVVESSLTDPSTIPKTATTVGLDLVVLDDYNHDLYESAHDFLDVFRSSFTQREFQTILDASHYDSQLAVFYVQWSIKESYTKAIGVGMGLDFSSFETELLVVEPESFWRHQFSEPNASDQQSRRWVLGRIQQLMTLPTRTTNSKPLPPSLQRPTIEYWWFGFYPLSLRSNTNKTVQGCATLCLGPVDKDTPLPLLPSLQWTTLDDLVNFHAPGFGKGQEG